MCVLRALFFGHPVNLRNIVKTVQSKESNYYFFNAGALFHPDAFSFIQTYLTISQCQSQNFLCLFVRIIKVSNY